MNYKIICKKENIDWISYQAYEKDKLAAEFSYYIEPVCDEADTGISFDFLNRFWIERIRLVSPYEEYQTLDAVIHFIQYKCQVAGYTEMYVRLSAKNLFYLELYRRYGFYVVASEQKNRQGRGCSHDYVLKYALPDTREEIYHSYIKRSGR